MYGKACALALARLVFGTIQFPCCHVFLWRDGSIRHRRELAEPQILARQAPQRMQKKT